jgi:wobble nucleotide-excising tRNase
MIESFAFIENIGRYERVQATPDLGGLTLIYSENGRGKTTLCAILRSFTTNDPTPIQERMRCAGWRAPQNLIHVV